MGTFDRAVGAFLIAPVAIGIALGVGAASIAGIVLFALAGLGAQEHFGAARSPPRYAMSFPDAPTMQTFIYRLPRADGARRR
jgi:hypothetical protein